ncbi:ComEA family DNA-binding protein [Arthrobacter tumbae]|uniref:ComEA family DNA-binding protein n=1 Tax=Arthrobacter tumbae TaxID=163874 RepID=UPI00195AAD26|nr:ComEA family DNA-binding protein [Arthrobacter tumbae]MBM7783186.1 competence protein ComEA [Arthrobacter tumbae]
MARHRWATGERVSSPDRLDRVLNLNRAEPVPEAERNSAAEQVPEPSWSRTGEGWGSTSPDGAGSSLQPGDVEADTPHEDSRSHRRRWVATRRAALVAAGCALVVGGWQFVSSDSEPGEVVPIRPPGTSTADPTPGSDSSANAAPVEEAQEAGASVTDAEPAHAGTVLVHVAGAVQTPGVVETAAGSRVFEVLEKAGGALPEAELSAVNLAAVVQDGQQILIPRAGEPLQPAAGASAPAQGTQDLPVNLNTADVPELEELPRVGPVLAERIVEWRTQHGPFARPEDLDAVPGIGPAMLESLIPLVTV